MPPKQTRRDRFAEQGLYSPAQEHDACGVGFVANISGEASHDVVRKGLEVLNNLEHRGACGCDPDSGDGAGLLVQIPDAFLRSVCASRSIELPEALRALAPGGAHICSILAQRISTTATLVPPPPPPVL